MMQKRGWLKKISMSSDLVRGAKVQLTRFLPVQVEWCREVPLSDVDASVNLIWPLLIFSFGPTLW